MSRVVAVPRDRLRGWIGRFSAAHGEGEFASDGRGARLLAMDGTLAQITVPFPPFIDDGSGLTALVDHVELSRRVGVLLVRKGGYLVAVIDGDEYVVSKVGSRHVQGRSAAGGWSQQRFARRRDAQARETYAAAADSAVSLLLPSVSSLDAVVTGGDRAAITAVLADLRLSALEPLVVLQRLDVPEPSRRLLAELPKRLGSSHITVTDPE